MEIIVKVMAVVVVSLFFCYFMIRISSFNNSIQSIKTRRGLSIKVSKKIYISIIVDLLLILFSVLSIFFTIDLLILANPSLNEVKPYITKQLPLILFLILGLIRENL